LGYDFGKKLQRWELVSNPYWLPMRNETLGASFYTKSVTLKWT